MDSKDMSLLKKLSIIGVLSLALAIIVIDGTLLNVSISTIVKELNTDIKSIQWVITAYSLTIAALTVTGGRLGDLFGRKKMFILGAVLFAIGSMIASYSQNITQMIIGESIIEGIGAALMMPATSSILASTFKGQTRAMAMGIYGGVAGASSAIGPILGGYLTTNYSWRWGFRINVVVALILIIGSVIIKEYKDILENPMLDLVGVLLSSTGLLFLVFGIIESSTYGWFKAKEVFSVAGHALNFGSISIVPPSLILSLALLLSFILWELSIEKKGQTPIVSMKLFQNKPYVSAILTLAIIVLGQAGLILCLPIFFQSMLGLDAYHTGIALLPSSIATFVSAPLAAVLGKKISTKYIIQVGIIANFVALVMMYFIMSPTVTAANFRLVFVLYGIGMGFVMAPINNIVMSSVSVQQAGEASGVSHTMRQLGSTLGSAIIGAVLLTSLTNNFSNGITNSPNLTQPVKNAITSNIEKSSSQAEFGGGVATGKPLSPAINQEITSIKNQAITDSSKKAILFASFIIIIGFLVSFALPIKNQITAQSLVSKKEEDLNPGLA